MNDEKMDDVLAEVDRLRLIEAAAVKAVLAGHYTARQQLITDLYNHGALTKDQVRAALRALDGDGRG